CFLHPHCARTRTSPSQPPSPPACRPSRPLTTASMRGFVGKGCVGTRIGDEDFGLAHLGFALQIADKAAASHSPQASPLINAVSLPETQAMVRSGGLINRKEGIWRQRNWI